MSAQAYIRRETGIGIAINALLSLVFFVLVFGGAEAVAVRGVGTFAFDFLPQSFLISLFSALVPGLLAGRKVKQGAVAPLARRSSLPSALYLRALLFGLCGTIIGGSMMLLLLSSELETLKWSTALASKIVYGGLLAALVTPIGLRATLSRR
jgi:uncharacterized membrane protein